MSASILNRPYTGPVQAVVLDWAGTAVDYGCMGPADVFVKVFAAFDITVTTAEARQFMGLEKKEHIRSMCKLPNIAGQWQEKYGQLPDNRDVEKLYDETEPMMVAAIADHAEPITGLLPFVEAMRTRKIKIGSCTGYTAPMMEVLVPEAARMGYRPDCSVCSSDVPAGRPFPWMCYQNAIQLQTCPFAAMIKIGDTVSDIEEGRNAGMWSVGLTQSGNELGLPEDQVAALPEEELNRRLAAIEARYKDAGAHYVVKGIWDCLNVVDDIARRLENGEQPC
ncbi:phosphonoacetaldehyde hydrolase [uncultured Desulfosarcina sp.]|uniref:phosphonoacetaldehyde hydrolase n=1 Tax=uncultured Desulfosarcina sp. TaxID=218289 RepID=UPI0029C64B34|nr:phosphonoacetaldehyde hydrolase [uncultured Desulfosarcina sp.]